MQRVLILGYGNPGRQDDGLGPAFVARLENLELPGVTTDANYQLMVEDATAIAEHDLVIFVDAALDAAPPFCLTRVTPAPDTSFSTHSVSPEALVHLAVHAFGARAETLALGIRGYEFGEFSEQLSAGAKDNLKAALAFLVPLLQPQAGPLTSQHLLKATALCPRP